MAQVACSGGEKQYPWIPYTPVITSESGGWTNYTATGNYRVVNDILEVNFKVIFSGASTTASQMHISLPSGYTIDSAVLLGGSGWDSDTVGTVILNDTGTIGGVPGTVNTRTTTTVSVKYFDDDAAGYNKSKPLSQSTPWSWANGDSIVGRFSAPIV